MKNDEFVLRVSDVAPELSGANSQERTCEECERRFTVGNAGLWVYKIEVKGVTHWFCRYNCMRAGEKKLEGSKAGRSKGLRAKENKPSRVELEKDLRTDMTLVLIAEKYVCSITTVFNWIKGYGLQEIRGIKKAELGPAVETVDTTSDTPAQTGLNLSKIPNLCPDEQEPDDKEPLLTDEEIKEIESRMEQPQEPEAQLEPEPEPYEEAWSDLRGGIVSLRRLYASDADKSFFDRLHGLFLEVRG